MATTSQGWHRKPAQRPGGCPGHEPANICFYRAAVSEGGLLGAQGGAVGSWEAEPAPGRTGGPVTWKRRDSLDSGTAAWASGAQHSTGAGSPSGRRLCRCPPWAPRGRRPSCRLGPVQATPPAPPCYWPRPLLPPAPHTALRGAGLPRPGAQPPKPSRKRTEGIGALSFPLPGPCDLISWSICSRASRLLLPACYLASAEKPPSRLASVLAPVGARDSVPGAKSWGSWGPADPSLVWRSC